MVSVIDFSITYINILLASAVISFLLGLLVLRQHTVNGIRLLVVSFFLISIWTFSAAVEGSAFDQATKIIWAKIQYVPAINIMPLLVTFVLIYTNRIKKPYPAWLSILWLIPVLVLVMLWRNEWQSFIWTGFQPVDPVTKLMIYEHGPVYWLIMAYTYMLVLFMLILLLIEMLRSNHRKFRWQSFLLFLATLVPAIGGIIYNSGINPIPGLDWTPVSVLVSVMLMTASVVGFGFMDIVPVARAILLEQMESGVIVIDPVIRVVDLNPAIKNFFKDQKFQIGMDASKMLASIGITDVKFLQNGTNVQQEIFSNQSDWYCLDFRLSELHYKNRFLGWIGEFRDISNQKKTEQEKEKINQQLNERLYEVQSLQNKLREQAIRDPLTNVFNRRFFDETFDREIALTKRSSQKLCVLMIDIDHFKQVNDEFGHDQGDRVLRNFGSLLMKNTRVSDVVCRYGGEEFIILLINVDIEQALVRANQLREAFRDMCLKDIKLKKELTISIGLSSYPKHGESKLSLVRKADEAMYVAKNSGRNRVEVAK
ncbi:MAG: histidine kinase N-terminal 7TM domain-containing diguanylate cyclase [Anaerolineaceae bacterium]